MKIKTGIGIDVHRLEPGLDFWLGGIKLEHEKGCVAHSDGDVLIHAICDALLGAAGLDDIGVYFPDTDPAYKGIDSKILLKKVIEIMGIDVDEITIKATTTEKLGFEGREEGVSAYVTVLIIKL